MAERKIVQPTEAHPITVEPTPGRVVVRVNGEVVADSRAALTLRESNYPAVQYIPMSDVVPHGLSRTETSTYCPYKGDASYYSVSVGDDTVEDVIWTYERPHPAVAPIAGHAAFYPDKAEVTVTDD